MHTESHHLRQFLIALLLSLIALALFARPAHPVWSADPLRLDPTHGQVPFVRACDGGGFIAGTRM